MKRVFIWQFSVVTLVFLTVLCAPPLRLLLSRQVTNALYNEPNPPFSLFKIFSLDRDRFLQGEKSATQLPEDAQAQFEIEQERLEVVKNQLSIGFGELQGRAYTNVYRRFPREKWLLDQALGNLLSRMLAHRNSEQMKGAHNEPAPSAATTSLVLQLSAEGQKLQPQNGFYDLCRAAALYALRRDDEALKAVQSASRKPFDDGATQATQARFYSVEKRSALLYEDRVSVVSAQLFPSYATFRAVGRLAVARAQREEARGKVQNAVQIYGDVARLGGQIRDSKSVAILSMVGRAIQENAWLRGQSLSSQMKNTPISSAPNRSFEQRITATARQFAAYSSTRNRPDLAREALAEAPKSALLMRQINAFSQDDAVFGSSWNVLQSIFAWKWIGAVLLSQIQFAVVCWLAVTLLIWRLRRAKSEIQVAQRTSFGRVEALTVLLIVVASASLLVLLWRVGFASVLTDDSSEDKSTAPWIALAIVALPLVLSAFVLALPKRRRGEAVAGAQAPTRDTEERDIEAPVVLPLLHRDISPFFKKLLPVFLVALAALFCFVAFAYLPDSGLRPNEAEWPLLGLIVCVLLGLWLRFRAARTDALSSTRFEALDAFGRLRAVLRLVIVVSSAAYLGSSLAALPLRHRADARLDAFVQQGEMRSILAQKT